MCLDREEGWTDGPSGCYVHRERDSCRVPGMSQGALQDHSPALVELHFASVQQGHPRYPGKAGQASNTQRKLYRPGIVLTQGLCVLPPPAELARGTEPRATPCSPAPAPGTGAPSASPSMRVAASAPTCVLRGLLFSLPHPLVLRARLTPSELGMPRSLYRGCEIHISAFTYPSPCAPGLSGEGSWCWGLSLIPSASQLCPSDQKKAWCSGRVCCKGCPGTAGAHPTHDCLGLVDPDQ